MDRMRIGRAALAACVALLGVSLLAQAQAPTKPFEPHSGQPGKDVVWVPTPQTLVDKMLDLAKVTPQDLVVDLGSGDGRTVITAAKRGAHAMGVEFNPDMVALSKRAAAEAGLSDRATFVEGDLFKTDFSKAQVVTMFLLPEINMKLRPKILDMKPGTRIVSNTFTMEDWEADQTATVEGCSSWCTALLWIVPAKIEGRWLLGSQVLTVNQTFQKFTGTLGSASITDGRLRGEEITFTAGGAKYSGKVNGTSMLGTVSGGPGGSWTATRAR